MQFSDDLYQLIKSLTKAEKRYFKMQASLQKGEKDYLLLFDAVDSLANNQGEGKQVDAYNEALLRQRLKGKVDGPQFHVMKNYLIGLLLKSLRSLSEKNNHEVQISAMLSEVKLLEQKGLYGLCSKKLGALKSLCLKYENYPIAVEVAGMERTLAVRTSSADFEVLDQYKRAIDRYVQLIGTILEYNDLRHRVLTLYRKENRARGEQAARQLEAIKENPLLQDESLPSTFQSKIGYYHIWALISLLEGNVFGAVGHYRKLMDIWEGYPHFKKARPSTYVIYASNYLVSCHMARNYGPFGVLIQELKSMPVQNIYEEVESFQNIYFLEQLLFMNSTMLRTFGEPKLEAKVLAATIEEGLERYGDTIVKSRKFSMLHNNVVIFFALGEYDEALRWISKILASHVPGQRQDILRFSRIVQLLIFTERGNHLYIDSTFKSFQYSLKKEDKKDDFEERVAFFLKQIASKKINKKSALAKMKTELEVFAQLNIPGYEEILIWIDSKLLNRTFLDVLRERATQQDICVNDNP